MICRSLFYFKLYIIKKAVIVIFHKILSSSPRIAMTMLFTAIILVFSSILLISTSMAFMLSGRIFYGITAADIPLGGLTTYEASAALQEHYRAKLKSQPLIQINHQNTTWTITADDIDLVIDYHAMAETAFSVGRDTDIITSMWQRLKSAHYGTVVEPIVFFNDTKLQSKLHDILANFSDKTIDARCTVQDGNVIISQEQTGQIFDIPDLLYKLASELAAMHFPIYEPLPLVTLEPKITSADLATMDSVLAVYTSYFDPRDHNRSENIRIAADNINGLLIKPQETISFNQLVGLRTAEAGFKHAGVIIDGRPAVDYGGGVCQVSSTLYNAILLADMKPVERTNHFHPLGYVPIGLDATVADNLIDFKFQNTLSHNVYITADIDLDYGQLTITVIGNNADVSPLDIALTSVVDTVIPIETIVEYDSSLPDYERFVKEPGIEGYIVSSFRVKSRNGQEIERELLYTDEYSMEQELIIQGNNSGSYIDEQKRLPEP